MEGVLTQEVHGGQFQRLVADGAARRLEHDGLALEHGGLFPHLFTLCSVLRCQLLLSSYYFIFGF